ncbi:hypothetical protein DBR33_06295, partial [Stenotrophomonas sp. HMWF022]
MTRWLAGALVLPLAACGGGGEPERNMVTAVPSPDAEATPAVEPTRATLPAPIKTGATRAPDAVLSCS